MLSKHFRRTEFACQCGCGFDTVDAELLMLCEDVREFEKVPVHILSGCRCVEHNAAVGGVDNSQHTKAKAADLDVKNPEKTYNYLCAKYPKQYGFGLYPWGVHVDSRSEIARWNRR